MSDKILSVVIPARNEAPNIYHTVYSILHCWEADGFDYKDIEIIIVDNCSTDDRFPQKGTWGTTSYFEGRGGYYNGIIRVIRDPIAGNHSARNTGAKVARGKYLYFSDAHVAIKPGYFKSILGTVEKYGGLVFGTLQTLGAYPPTDSGSGFQYTWKLGDECKQTWANYKLADTPWYIIGQGAWGMACKREEFFEIGGYEHYHKTYGGEFYLTSKAWMMGYTVMVDPNAIGYHLASGRNYSYNHLDYVANILNLLYALGADSWRERTYINYLRSKDKDSLDKIMTEGEKVYADDRKKILDKSIYSFDDLLVKQPWKQKNMELHGKSNCGILIFHWSELELIAENPIAKEAYLNSRYQQELGEFIEKELKEVIYKDSDYRKNHSEDNLLNLRERLEY
jgi:glycosyltransferase involved in cell wall biosynthesis